MSIDGLSKKEGITMPQYEARIQFKAESDEAAKQGAKSAARAVNGKVSKLLAERLAFRSLENEAPA